MMHLFQKLSPVQKQFTLYTSVSLVALGIVLFLIHGLSGVSLSGNKSAAFERKYNDRAATALTNVWNSVAERTLFFETAAMEYEEETVFPTLASTTVPLRDALHTVLEERSLAVKHPAVNPSIPDNSQIGCEQALEQEVSLLHTLDTEIERIGVNPEVYGIFMTFKDQSETAVVPMLEACTLGGE